jgi:hypothetical protein
LFVAQKKPEDLTPEFRDAAAREVVEKARAASLSSNLS